MLGLRFSSSPTHSAIGHETCFCQHTRLFRTFATLKTSPSDFERQQTSPYRDESLRVHSIMIYLIYSADFTTSKNTRLLFNLLDNTETSGMKEELPINRRKLSEKSKNHAIKPLLVQSLLLATGGDGGKISVKR